LDLDFIVSSFVFISNWKVRFFLVVKTVSVKIIFYFEKGSYKNYVVLTFTAGVVYSRIGGGDCTFQFPTF